MEHFIYASLFLNSLYFSAVLYFCHVIIYDDAYRAYLFYYGNSSSSGTSILPLGSLQYDFLNEIEFFIVDSIGDYFIFKKNLTVSALCFIVNSRYQI